MKPHLNKYSRNTSCCRLDHTAIGQRIIHFEPIGEEKKKKKEVIWSKLKNLKSAVLYWCAQKYMPVTMEIRMI